MAARGPARRGGDRPNDRPAPKISVDLYGRHAVLHAILNPDRDVSAIYATPDQQADVATWVAQARQNGVARPGPTIVPAPALASACGGAGVVHQGVGVATAPLPEVSLDDILRHLPATGPAVLVMLDQVTDPHNFGAILRSACAFGAVGVIVQRRHAPDLSALIAKIACGAVEHIGVAFETNLARAIDTVRDHDFRVVGLDERGARTIGEGPRSDRTMIVMGAEGPGLRRLVREGCDELVRLPTQGPIASLNVSNAAAVALYAVCADKG